MALTTVATRLPDYANDLKLNLSSVLLQTELTPEQAWGALVASAYATGNAWLFGQIEQEAHAHLSEEALKAARAAAAIMGMNNVYYRFQHLTQNQKYRTLPAKLRMNIMKSHGVDPLHFELWALVVSAINACSLCVEAHERALREKGITEETIAAAVRIGAVVTAVASVLTIESAAAHGTAG